MKKDWTYKKLGEVLLIERGGSPRPIQEYITTADDGLNWIKIGDAVEGSKYITSTKEKIKPEGLKKTRFVHKGDFILSNSMSFGRPYILGIDGCIHDGWLVLRDNDDTFDKSYLYYYLSNPYLYEEFKRLAVGGVVNNLNSDIVRNVQVAIPPLSIQRSIVSELDLLHSLIEKKQEQLRALDNLAQSLFYQMFGDPITNPMGWEIKKLGEVCVNITDGDHMPPPKSNDGVPFITISNINKESNQIDFTNTFFVPQIYYDAIKDERKARIGDVLYTVTGSYGIPIIVDDDKPFCFQRHIGLLRPNQDIIIPVYLVNWIKSEGGKQQADAKATGIAQKTVSLSSLKTFSLPLPPLSLQQSFAAKVSAIEEQKRFISQSIKDVESLLAQRMDHYFG